MSNPGAAPRDTLEVTSATGDTTVTDSAAIVDRAITTRRSIRAFLDTPVPRETVEDILAVASRAPSGTNTQPWRVYVLSGDAKARLCADVLAAYHDPSATPSTARSIRTTRASGSTRTWRAAARWAGTCTACWRSVARTRRACTSSTPATSASSTRRSA
ncbi:nitroreductase family protein [Cupriavidus campinensis]|uniref:nitroreductase family protein n=1 Tax=Cupriavidus campinensis TaxID=151783 RepID=UPI003709B4CA